jgi:hypothetical protein
MASRSPTTYVAYNNKQTKGRNIVQPLQPTAKRDEDTAESAQAYM